MDKNSIPEKYLQIYESKIPTDEVGLKIAKGKIQAGLIAPLMNFLLDGFSQKKRGLKEAALMQVFQNTCNDLLKELDLLSREDFILLCGTILYLSDWISFFLTPEQPTYSVPATAEVYISKQCFLCTALIDQTMRSYIIDNPNSGFMPRICWKCREFLLSKSLVDFIKEDETQPISTL